MRRNKVRLWVAIAALMGTCGCHRPSTEAYVAALEELAEITSRYERDCEQMAGAIREFLKQRGEPLRDYQAHAHRLSKKERQTLEGPKYGPRIRKAMDRLAPGHERCLGNRSIAAAFEAL